MSLSDVTGPFKMFSSKQKTTPVVVKKNLPAPSLHITSTTGMPPGWSDRLHSHIETASRNKAIPITATAATNNDLSLVGHLSAADISTGTVVAYVWDVQDEKGNRLHRISGQKKLDRKGPRGAWSAINDQTLQLIGEETAAKIQGWMTAQGYILPPVQLAQTAIEPSEPPKNQIVEREAISTPKIKPIATPRVKERVRKATTPIENKTKQASVNSRPLPAPSKNSIARETSQKALATKKQELAINKAKKAPNPSDTHQALSKTNDTSFVFVDVVNGARGTGNAELTRAIISSLAKNGLGISPTPQTTGYKLEGEVKIEPVENGQDQVVLSWAIKTADGTLIGTVSQKNQVKSGSFNQTWGQTAFLAADAAAGSIKMVIDKREKLKI